MIVSLRNISTLSHSILEVARRRPSETTDPVYRASHVARGVQVVLPPPRSSFDIALPMRAPSAVQAEHRHSRRFFLFGLPLTSFCVPPLEETRGDWHSAVSCGFGGDVNVGMHELASEKASLRIDYPRGMSSISKSFRDMAPGVRAVPQGPRQHGTARVVPSRGTGLAPLLYDRCSVQWLRLHQAIHAHRCCVPWLLRGGSNCFPLHCPVRCFFLTLTSEGFRERECLSSVSTALSRLPSDAGSSV